MANTSSSSPNISKIARYEILREIGHGGMAIVYLAHDPNFQREVAIKVLPREALHDSTLYQRFQREARTIASLEHPAIVPVHDFGEENGQPFLVMRYLSGGSLANRIKQGPLSVAECAKVLLRIGGALDAAHAKGVVHRDLKPANILFDQYGEAYLSDFGIAQLSEATSPLTGSTVLGTPAYMSPEQIRGDGKVDGRSDIYALGIVLFEMLTGKPPFKADTPAQMMMAHLANPTPRLPAEKSDLPDSINGVLIRAMAKDPEFRFQTASELGNLLAAIASGQAPALTETAATNAFLKETSATRIDAEPGSWRKTAPTQGKEAASPLRHKTSGKWLLGIIGGLLGLGICFILSFVIVLGIYPPARSGLRGFLQSTTKPPLAIVQPTSATQNTGTIANTTSVFPMAQPSATKPTEMARVPSQAVVLDTVGPLNALGWSPDGTMLATAGNSDGSVRIWKNSTWDQIALLQGNSKEVNSLAWSPKGDYLATYDKENKVILWDVKTWSQTASFFIHNGENYFHKNILWTIDGMHIGALSIDGVQLFAFNNPNKYDLFCTSICVYSGLTFSPDGKEMASLGPKASSGYRIYIWNLSTKKLTSSLESEEGTYQEGIEWSPDGKVIAVGADVWNSQTNNNIIQSVWFWRMDTKTRINPTEQNTHTGTISDISWAPDSSQLASGGINGNILLWDPTTGDPWYAFASDSIGLATMINICSIAWSPDGQLLAIGYQEGKVLLWKAPSINKP
jgi:serine/threonine-protein kinase